MPHPDGQKDFYPDWPPPFRATVLKSEKVVAAVSILAGKNHYILQEKGVSGYFVYLSLVLEDADNLKFQLDLDGQTIFDHSFADLEAAAAGDLNIDTADAGGNLIHLPDASASYKSIIIDTHQQPWPFGRSLDLKVRNIHATTTYKIQAALLIWSQTRAEVLQRY